MKIILFILLFIQFHCTIFSEVISKEGQGYLEVVNGQKILHVKGQPYEMGFQHGKLLKNDIHNVVKEYILTPRPENEKRLSNFNSILPALLSHTPEHFKQEMQGLSEGAEIPLQQIIALNLFPEMVHCSGLTVNNELTVNHKLYHVRVLDYNIGRGLEKYSTLIIAQPEGKIPFMNVSYAGFIGSITGINYEKISFGEIGGAGYGHWNGMPMPFLIRTILENAHNLDEVEWILREAPRTCEYYYVIADGKTDSSRGVYATQSQIHFIEPGSSYAMLSPSPLPKNYGEEGRNDKFFLSTFELKSSSYQTIVSEGDKVIALFNKQPKNALILTGYNATYRYSSIVEQVVKNTGRLDEKILSEVIKMHAKDSNLHNAIFLPSELKVWISHREGNKPAYQTAYQMFELEKLIK